MSGKTLYASFIGINDYAQSPLSGCVKDVLDFDLFLRNFIGQQKDILYQPLYFFAPNKSDLNRIDDHKTAIKESSFTYSPATFSSITQNAFKHLKKAENGDICLLYYSGHGSQAEAPKEFWHLKPDRQNETIVCVDSRDPDNKESRDIIDKELAFLLWDALDKKEVHCLVIMDCCHSGNNTRAALENNNADYRFRYVPSARNKIPIEDYLGYKEGFFNISAGKAKFDFARYVHLAASRDSEKAMESFGGLFSMKLLDALNSGGTSKVTVS